ncbi:acetylglutamate kinase [Candidatus Marinamargulisbacteria bacterium SCGC AG-343-K17]|nr:acetylglutamate kinase [Candidatus Marinamargulisbacteria bacterium SCGC AG-343-K17]
MKNDKKNKAITLVEALPYIKQFSGQIMVVKYGGSLMVNEDLRETFAKDIVLLRYVGIKPVIVHGGGKEITKWMKKLGKEAVFIDGQRFTDSETMELTEMVLSGKVNNEIVSLLNQHGGKAVTLSGKSANIFNAKRIRSKKDQDLGLVGTIESVDTRLIHTLCDDGYIPVISSVGSDRQGETLNLNADNVASAVARYLECKKLIYLTDVDGLLVDKKLVSSVTLKEADDLLLHPDVQGGMLPKLECSLQAVKEGVESVHIINGSTEHAVLLEIFTDRGIGTMVKK